VASKAQRRLALPRPRLAARLADPLSRPLKHLINRRLRDRAPAKGGS